MIFKAWSTTATPAASLGSKVDATPVCAAKARWSLMASAGVLQSRVLRGRVLRAVATAARSLTVCRDRSVPLGASVFVKRLGGPS